MKRKTRLLLTATLVLVSLCGTILYVSCTPNTAEGFVRRGYKYEEKGELDMAIADYTEAIRLDPNYSEAYRYRAFAYLNNGNKDNALYDYTTVIRLDPNDVNAYYFRAGIYVENGNFNSAIADYEAYLKIRPDDEYVKEKLNNAKAEEIRLNPKNADDYFKRGYQNYMHYMNTRDPTTKSQIANAMLNLASDYLLYKAIEDFEAALRLNPNHADAKSYLEQARRQMSY